MPCRKISHHTYCETRCDGTYDIRRLFFPITYVRFMYAIYFAVRWPHYTTKINYVSYLQVTNKVHKSQHWMCQWFSETIAYLAYAIFHITYVQYAYVIPVAACCERRTLWSDTNLLSQYVVLNVVAPSNNTVYEIFLLSFFKPIFVYLYTVSGKKEARVFSA